MSHTAPVAVDEAIETNFKKAVQDGSFKGFHLQLKDEKFVEVGAYPGTGNPEEDFKTMTSKATDNEASFFLYAISGNKNWLLITYVPDGVSVKDKMTYASCKATLKNKLGFQYFAEESHAVTLEELSYTSYKNSQKQVDSRSEFERMHETVLKQEEEERADQLTRNVSGGGYHAVSIPLETSANEHLQKFKDGSVNFVELAITEDKSKIEGKTSSTVSVADLPSHITTTEPRFYVYAYTKVGGTGAKSNLFIYCCPENSNAKLRMVYSTAKPNLAKSITQFGISLAQKKIEIREGSELTEATLREESGSRISNINLTGRMQTGSHFDAVPLGGVTKAKNPNTVAEGHPVYSLMGGQTSSSPSGKKKIVIPPKGAW